MLSSRLGVGILVDSPFCPWMERPNMAAGAEPIGLVMSLNWLHEPYISRSQRSAANHSTSRFKAFRFSMDGKVPSFGAT